MTDNKKPRAPWQVPNHQEKPSEPPSQNKASPWQKPAPKHEDYQGFERGAPRERSAKSPRRGLRLLVFFGGLFGLYFLGKALIPDFSLLDAPYSFYSLIWVILIGGSLVYFSRSSMGTLFRYAGIWLIITGVLSMSYVSFFQKNDILSSPSRTKMIEQNGVMEIERSIDGHFWVLTNINGTSLPMMVDTGASMVVLSKADAVKVGINLDTLIFNGRSTTANGTVSFALTRLESFYVGSTGFENFYVTVNGGEMDGSLLGMDAINKFSTFEISGNTLRLTPKT